MYWLLFRFYSRYLVWKKEFKWRYVQYRYGQQLHCKSLPDIDATVQILFQTATSKLTIGSGFMARNNCSILLTENASINLGNNVFFNRLCSFNAMQCIEIGDNTIFGENVKIYDHNHKFREKEIKITEQGYKMAPVIIGKNCWIGSDCIILPGVTIGDNVVIGAGNLIFKSIESNSIIVSKREVIQSVI